MKKMIELLAPAGSIESFYAAVNSGADAVYLGGKDFNARQSSQNFDNDEMMDIIRYAHNKDVKVYVTLNTVLKDIELTEVLNYAIFLYENDADAVIVQDLGLLYLLRKYLPDLNVNISTQAVTYDEYGVKFYDEQKINKIIMARELSVSQLKEVAAKTETELEVFVHGALCACYSGQCYMSSFLGGRSGNRGKCAQPCRLNYSFFDKNEDAVVEDFGVVPVLSIKDFKAGKTVMDLIDAGITTFKIEGRMKGPEYTAVVVEYYRKIIDNYINNKNEDTRILEKKAVSAFSRGFTNGYLNPSMEDQMFARTSSGVKGNDIDEISEEVKGRFEEFSSDRRNNVDFELTLKIGEPAVLTANDGKHTITIKSKELCEVSVKNPATDEIITEQLSKLGSSIYVMRNLKINKDDDVFLRKSTLNQIRRDAIDYLYEEGSIFYNRESVDRFVFGQLFNTSIKGYKGSNNPRISLKINCVEDIDLIDNVKIKRVYVPYTLDMNAIKDISGVEKYLWIPNIVSKADYAWFRKNMKTYESIFEGVCVNNTGSYYFFKENSGLKLHCGSNLNILNSYGAKMMEEKGAEGFTFSVETNIKDMENILKNTVLKTEITAHAYVQMMTMKNCPMSMMKNCKNLGDCNSCEFKDSFALKDRKEVLFNIERENRLTKIYNSVPLTLIGKIDDFVRCGIEYFLIDSKWEEDIEDIIDAVYCEIHGVQTANVLRENNFTRGHYLKNIL